MLLYIYEYYRYLSWVLKPSTWVLKYLSTKPKLRYMGKVYGVTQGACNLYEYRSMQPEHKSQT